MSEINQIKEEINRLEKEIAPLAQSLSNYRDRLRHCESLEYIRVNRITADQVEIPDGEDRPWFGHFRQFGVWLAGNSKKRWASWNGRIYFAADLIAGHLPDTPAIYSDLEGAS